MAVKFKEGDLPLLNNHFFNHTINRTIKTKQKAMKHFYTLLFSLIFTVIPLFSYVLADVPIVTVRDLNTYEQTPENMIDLADHPLVDSLVQFTAIISSYPKNSGLASPDFDNPNDVVIGRIHVFVIDTTAYSQGREGMAMQLVVTDPGLTVLENLERGEIITIRGRLSFYAQSGAYTAQFNSDDIRLEGDAWNDTEFMKYQELLDPWVISLTEINQNTPAGYSARLDNYTKYHAQYVKIENAVIQNRDITSTRPWMYVQQDGVIAYNRDTSLRYRNDRVNGYRAGYNYRRLDGADGLYEPPPPGAVINYSGYVVANSFDGDNVEDNNNPGMAIVAMEDGVRWLGEGETAVRFTNENLPPQYPYPIPNDLEIIGFPPEIFNYQISRQIAAPNEQVEISFSVSPAGENETIEKVELTYWANGEETTVPLTGSNGNYTFTFPTFDDLTSVIFEIRATDSNDITGILSDGDLDEDQEPLVLKFFVLESKIDSISVISKTSDEKRGPSPLFGFGELPVDLTAVVVADSSNGFIVIHESNEPWSGLFLEPNSETMSLKRGDRVHITTAEVGNTNTNNNYANITYLFNIEYDVVETGVDLSGYIPVLSTQDLVGHEDQGARYEAMVVRVENAHVATNQADAPASDFGEWAFASGSPEDNHPSVRVRFNIHQSGLRIFNNFNASYNDDIKTGAELEYVSGVLGYSFGNAKMTLRDEEDVKPVDDMFYPGRVFPIFMPSNNAVVDVDRNFEAQWAGTVDRDGDEVTYHFLLTTPDDTAFENHLLKLPSDDDGKESTITIPYQVMDAFLDGRGLDDGESEPFIWTLWVSDGRDTVQISTKSGPNFNPVFRNITLQRNTTLSAEDGELPRQFRLAQNYPNPFNPTTKIVYELPQQAHVKMIVYDLLGRAVLNLVNEEMPAGRHHVTFDAAQLASGVYLYRMEAESFSQTKKMMLIK